MSETHETNLPRGPVPSHPSNRNVIHQAMKWGAVEEKVKGEETWLRTPTGERIKVKSAHSHLGNSPAEIDTLIDALGLSPAAFWTGPWVLVREHLDPVLPPPATKPLGEVKALIALVRALIDEMAPVRDVRDTLDRIVKAAQGTAAQGWADEHVTAAIAEVDRGRPIITGHDEAAFLIFLDEQSWAEKREQEQAQPEQEPDMPRPKKVTPALKAVKRVRRYGGATHRIFDLLTERGHPMSTYAISEALAIPRNTVSSACGHLTNGGHLRRLKSGVYEAVKAAPAEHGVDVRFGLIEGGAETEYEYRSEPTPEPIVIERKPPTVDSIDDEVNTVLDLLFPDGMTIRAGDLPAINGWLESTKTILRQVRS